MISDTHGYLDEAVFKHFEECDEVWHAGDFGAGVAAPLAAFKPLRGVWGNIDDKGIRQEFPEHNRFMCEDVDVIPMATSVTKLSVLFVLPYFLALI